MSSSLSEQFTVRAARDADAEAVAGLSAAAERAVRGEADIDAADVRDWWRLKDLERDSWLIEDAGRIVAAATLFPRGEAPNVWGDVHPEHNGRGLGSMLVDLTEARARDLGAKRIRREAFGANRAARALFEARGYCHVRTWYTMRIDLADEPPPEPEWPVGVYPVPFRLEDAEAFHAAQTEAFEDEWGFVPLPFEEWRKLRLEADDFEPSLWTMARDGDEVAAVVRCDAFRYGGGWVGLIGVRKPWRRRGLGLALLHHTFRLFHNRGERRIGLGVDSANATGATELYERAGMYVETEEVTYERDLTSS
jgi:mycothiol synthase